MTGVLEGRRILVTGGGSGIGRAAVGAYLEAGAHVTVLERSAENADALSKVDVPGVGGRLEVVVGDATDVTTVGAAVEQAAGPSGLDNLTCCVGIFDYYASLRELSSPEVIAAATESWQVNVLSVLLAAQAAYSDLARARGSITLTLSESAFHAVGGGVLYGSTKWALRGVVSHLSSDFAPKVRVNGVAPGGTTNTRFGGLAALSQEQTADRVSGRDARIAAANLLEVTPRPEDHSGAYVYLADPVAARVCTGVVINTDAGRRL